MVTMRGGHYSAMLARVMLILLLANKPMTGQLNPKLSLSPAFLREQSAPFKFKRSAGYNARYNVGLGADVFLVFSKYNVAGKRGYRFGPSVGQYYFWNNSVKTFDYNFEYKENNLVSPFLMNLGFGNDPRDLLKGTKRISYSVDIAAGAAYIQNSIRNIKTAEVITSKKWAEMVKLRFHIMLALPSKRLPYIGIGLEYVYLDRRNFGSVFY